MGVFWARHYFTVLFVNEFKCVSVLVQNTLPYILMYVYFFLNLFEGGKVQVGNSQEMAQSERNSHVKTRGGKKLN